MGWRDLIQTEGQTVVYPWTGGRRLFTFGQTWDIDGRIPREFGWYIFSVEGRKARLHLSHARVDSDPDKLQKQFSGYLVGDRIVEDNAIVDPDPQKIAFQSQAVFLIESGLDRFARVRVGQIGPGTPLIYCGQEMPLGPEDAVLTAYLDQVHKLDIPGVPPALVAAFNMETWQRAETEKRRREAEKRRREEEARRELEERRAALATQLGSAQGRRAMAHQDFGEAARAALAVTSAEYMDHRQGANRNEMIVRFRFENRRFECVCDKSTLQIIDAGICLTDHNGEKGDTYFTLESLPSVIREAIDGDVLHVFRHV